MARDFSKRFYDSKSWKDLARLSREKKHFICDKCGRPGATQVHHIIELTPDNINNPSISLNPRNLMLLCNDCHNRMHHRFEQGASSRTYSYDSEGHVVAVQEKERRH
ncbi:HNH endonuclease [Acidaminococcus intestini]|uniref:HNH endonuclease n=1 Tax=Acidaminococcus intestini TaxID=187327 RepID=UPI002E7A47B6|nr:HNH endonuclease [Acidaminococcus intestini]